MSGAPSTPSGPCTTSDQAQISLRFGATALHAGRARWRQPLAAQGDVGPHPSKGHTHDQPSAQPPGKPSLAVRRLPSHRAPNRAQGTAPERHDAAGRGVGSAVEDRLRHLGTVTTSLLIGIRVTPGCRGRTVMNCPLSRGAFAAVIRHFENPHFNEGVLPTATTEKNGEPIQSCPPGAHDALYGPNADAQIATTVWQQTLRAAGAEVTLQGPWQLLAIWLAPPRLSGTAYRICDRVHIDRSGVEAEMALALLEELRTMDPESPCPVEALIRTACGSGWHFARAAAREAAPSAYLEEIAGEDHRAMTGRLTDHSAPHTDFEPEVIRPGGAADLNASPHVQASTTQWGEEVLDSLTDRLRPNEVVGHARRSRRRRPIGALPLRRRTRRR